MDDFLALTANIIGGLSEAKKERKRKSSVVEITTNSNFYIIYDSSFLMTGTALPFDAMKVAYMYEEQYLYPVFGVHHVLLDEVKAEIANNLKDQKGRVARGNCVNLLEQDNIIEDSAQRVPLINFSNDPLGPDSNTDKKIISYAYNLFLEKPEVERQSDYEGDPKEQRKLNTYVCIATRDGGISYDIVRRAKAENLNLITLHTSDDIMDWIYDSLPNYEQ